MTDPALPQAAQPDDSIAASTGVGRLTLAVVALVFSGASQVFASAPYSWYAAHLLSFVPALYVLDRLHGRRALLAGWLVGISANFSIFYWVVQTVETFSNLPIVLAYGCLLLFSLAFGFYFAVFGWGFAPIKRMAGPWWPVAIAAWFAAVEYLNPQLFPYFQGVSFYQEPRVFLVASLTGVPGLSFFVLLVNCIVLDLVLRRRDGVAAMLAPSSLRNMAVAGAFLLLSVAWSSHRLQLIEAAEAEAETVRVALVQTNRNVHQVRAMNAKSRFAKVNDFVDLSLEALAADPEIDVFVWPEGALSGGPGARRNRRARQFVAETGVELWTGGSSSRRDDEGRRRSYNSAFRVHGEGTIEPRYNKNILLPFGEFMPFEELLPILKKIQGVGNFEAGSQLTLFESDLGDFVFLICYEAIRHRYVRGGVNQGADLLVNITYDAWFGDTGCPHQHLMLSAIQGALYGLPLIRAATTGISAVVDARGMLVETTGVFDRTVLVRDVKRLQVPSVYAQWGDWFAWLCVLSTLVLLARGWLLQAPAGRRGWVAWVAVCLWVLAVPAMWGANPYQPVMDWICWSSWLAVVLGVPALVFWRLRGRAVDLGEKS